MSPLPDRVVIAGLVLAVLASACLGPRSAMLHRRHAKTQQPPGKSS